MAMQNTHAIRCSCGAVAGTVVASGRANHGVCYCDDCQAFAHFLGRAPEILDPRGGTEVVQVRPRDVTFSAGVDRLACMRLTAKGVVWW
jgi:hypothetical protein